MVTVLVAIAVILAELAAMQNIEGRSCGKLLTLGRVGAGLFALCQSFHRLDFGAVHTSTCGDDRIAVILQPSCVVRRNAMVLPAYSFTFWR